MTSDATLATTHVLHWCVSAGLWANKAGLFTYMCKKKKVRANAWQPCVEPLFPTRRVPCGWETASRAGRGHVLGITLNTLWPQTDHSATNLLLFGFVPYWHDNSQSTCSKVEKKEAELIGSHSSHILQLFLKHLFNSCINTVALTHYARKIL